MNKLYFASAFSIAFIKMAAVSSDRHRSKDPADQNFDYMFKLLIIGNSSVGKTSFLFRYSDDSFTSAFVSTVGIDFKVQTVFRNDKRIKLQIWDTAGQERYRTITTAYYRGAMGFILMYDVTNEESFKAVADWAGQVKTYSWDNTQVVLVGNKCDMDEERAVTYEQGKKLSEQLGFPFFETSAKDNINVRAAFDKLVDVICDRMTDTIDTDPTLIGPNRPNTKFPNQPSGGGCSC
ncbi:ras-related protein Rab-3B [Hydra vulgaris]|uniref:Ras-related protein Rab-3B n=1 Tax=Hydra vulgaris TaxID=6087 RepID=T2M7Z5_HYDVU|nr:ras-related protein Rab-3B [Hydra vulgaris]XP_012558391.1 ras-related protein Rab-3B [Hydra vulgaris]XP_047122766.1 ras-related protein Rab-3B [Hydra vulgaris]